MYRYVLIAINNKQLLLPALTLGPAGWGGGGWRWNLITNIIIFAFKFCKIDSVTIMFYESL